MSQRKRYRKEVSRKARQPDDGDHYCLAISPPRNDSEYCAIHVNGRTWGQGGRRAQSRGEAVDYLQSKVEEFDEKARDDKYRGSLPRYPEPPKPANLRYVVHPDFQDEISAREVWGDSTLSSFGGSHESKFADKPWYQHREAYQKWLVPLRDSPRSVLRVFSFDLGVATFWWYTVQDGGLYVAIEQPDGRKTEVGKGDWTVATRRAGGIGIIYKPPADIRTVDRSESPFANGIDEDAVIGWLEEYGPEVLNKADANQITEDGEEDEKDATSLADRRWSA